MKNKEGLIMENINHLTLRRENIFRMIGNRFLTMYLNAGLKDYGYVKN